MRQCLLILLAGLLLTPISPATASPNSERKTRTTRTKENLQLRRICKRSKPTCRKHGSSPQPPISTPAPPATTPSPAPVPEPTPVPTTCAGMQLAAGADIANAIGSSPAGATFCLAPGTYAVKSPLIPKTGQAFLASIPGTAVLTGNDSTTMAFNGEAITGVVIKGLVIEHFNTPAQGGLAALKTGRGWVVEGSEIHHNSALGLYHESDTRISNNFIHHNGQMGIAAYLADNAVVENNEISYNNTRGFAQSAEGGSKWARTVNLVLRNNYFHHNFGNGLWVDGDNLNVLIENNRSINNDGKGIHYEISCAGIVRNNLSARNGEAGIEIVASQDVEVYGNVVEDNGYGIRVWQQVLGSGPNCAWVLKNVRIHDNSISMSAGYTGLQRYGNGTSDAVFSDGTVRFVNNSYTLGPGTKYFHWLNNLRTVEEWKNFGQDGSGTFK